MGDIINIYIITNGILGDNERWLANDNPPYKWTKDEGVFTKSLLEITLLLCKVQKIYPFSEVRKFTGCYIKKAKT
jgi:hypothetical protein